MLIEPSTYKMDIMTNWSLSKEHKVGLTIKKLLQLNKKNGQTLSDLCLIWMNEKNYITSANQAPKRHKFKSMKDGITLAFKLFSIYNVSNIMSSTQAKVTRHIQR